MVNEIKDIPLNCLGWVRGREFATICEEGGRAVEMLTMATKDNCGAEM